VDSTVISVRENFLPSATSTFFIIAMRNEPSVAKAGWVIEQLRTRNLCPAAQLTFALGRQVFRPDIFEQAVPFVPTPQLFMKMKSNLKTSSSEFSRRQFLTKAAKASRSLPTWWSCPRAGWQRLCK
jgi:hypothetical protein